MLQMAHSKPDPSDEAAALQGDTRKAEASHFEGEKGVLWLRFTNREGSWQGAHRTATPQILQYWN